MNIITKFDDSRGDKAIFIVLKNSKQIISGEVNIVIIFPKKMKILKDNHRILTALAEGVVANLPRQPQRGVTIVRKIKGLSAMSKPRNLQGRFDAEIRISAQISSFFEF